MFDQKSVFLDYYFQGKKGDAKKLELCWDMLAGLAEVLIEPQMFESEFYEQKFRETIANNVEVIRANLQFLLNKCENDIKAWERISQETNAISQETGT